MPNSIHQLKTLIAFVCLLALLGCSRNSDTQKNSSSDTLPKETSTITSSANKPTFNNPEVSDSLEYYENESSNEENINSKYPDLFSREGKSLKIKNKLDQIKTYTDDFDSETPPKSDEESVYRIIRYWPEHALIAIRKSSCSGECLTVLLVDLDHEFKEANISGFPSISKDGTRIASFNVDLYAGFFFNGITIYKRSTANELTEEFSSGDTNWGVDSLQWESHSAITASTKFQCKDVTEVKVCAGKKLFVFENNKWLVD